MVFKNRIPNFLRWCSINSTTQQLDDLPQKTQHKLST